MKRQFIHACIASLVLLVLSFWLLGFKLETDGSRLLVVSRLDVSLAWLLGAPPSFSGSRCCAAR